MNALLQAHRVQTTLTTDGTITIESLPFHAGEVVEVIVLGHEAATVLGAERYPLRGMPYQLVSPTEPVADEDWSAAA